MLKGLQSNQMKLWLWRFSGMITSAKSAALDQVPPGVRRQSISGIDAIQQAYNGPNIGTVVDALRAAFSRGAILPESLFGADRECFCAPHAATWHDCDVHEP